MGFKLKPMLRWQLFRLLGHSDCTFEIHLPDSRKFCSNLGCYFGFPGRNARIRSSLAKQPSRSSSTLFSPVSSRLFVSLLDPPDGSYSLVNLLSTERKIDPITFRSFFLAPPYRFVAQREGESVSENR